ncbi:MAG: carbonic anhydrase [Candidatus Krumholzibacteriia bacterium]
MTAATNPRAAATSILSRLLRGNEGYAAGRPERPRRDRQPCRELCAGQSPVAVVIGCSDSRVSPEIVFDQGCGDLFVIRTAGHVLDGASLASLEFGVVSLSIPLVVVLGHTGCGAVKAAVGGAGGGHHLPGLLRQITPAVPDTLADGEDPVHATVLRHLGRTVTHLRQADPTVAPRHARGEVTVVGMLQDLATHRVSVMHGIPDDAPVSS